LVERIGVYKLEIFHEVDRILFNVEQRPKLELLPDWYY